MYEIEIMTKQKITYFLRHITGLIILLFGSSLLIFGQKLKCKEKNFNDFKYQIALTNRTVSGPPTLVLYLSIKSKNFNQEDMKKLARMLERKYCNESRVSALIFDDRHIFYSEGIEWTAYRGDIEIDRPTSKCSINFSTQRGNSRKEVVIEIEPSKIMTP